MTNYVLLNSRHELGGYIPYSGYVFDHDFLENQIIPVDQLTRTQLDKLDKRKDYHIIEMALNCLFGSNCLIPYPDYLKMGKLHIGEMTEMAQRVKTLENTDVLKSFDADGTSDSDIMITVEEEQE